MYICILYMDTYLYTHNHDFFAPNFMGVHKVHPFSSPSRSYVGVHELNLKYCCEISGFLEFWN